MGLLGPGDIAPGMIGPHEQGLPDEPSAARGRVLHVTNGIAHEETGMSRHRRIVQTQEQSPIYRYAKRAYFILDRTGTVKYAKVQDNPLDLLKPEEILKAVKESGA
jgi:hypothetical protein